MKLARVYKSPAQLTKIARLLLKHRLYVKGWCLRDIYDDIVEEYSDGGESDSCYDDPIVAVYYHEGGPVACAVMVREELHAYCQYKHRRHGYAAACVKAVKKELGPRKFSQLEVYSTDHGGYFWPKMGLDPS